MSDYKLAAGLIELLREQQFSAAADLPWGKFLFHNSQRSVFAKASSSKKGIALIRAEAEGLALIRPLLSERLSLPKGLVTVDDSEGIVLELSQVEGRPISKWRKASVELTPILAKNQQAMDLSSLLDKEQINSSMKDFLVGRFGDVKVPVTLSHGDMIYWNLLVGAAQPGLVDFEYVSPHRVLGFDDLHYRFAPWMLRWIRWGLPTEPLMMIGRRYARRLCGAHHLSIDPDLLLALFFAHWNAIQRLWHADFEPWRIETVDGYLLKC